MLNGRTSQIVTMGNLFDVNYILPTALDNGEGPMFMATAAVYLFIFI